MSKSVFVIGATGLVGRAMVAEYHSKGYQVIANVSSAKSNKSAFPEGTIIVENNLNNFYGLEETIAAVDTVIHCAAYVNFNPKYARKVLDSNVSWTREIVNLCLKFNKKLIHVSSIGKFIYKAGTTITEESESGRSQPFSAYPGSKYFSELEVWRGIAEGLQAIILIPGIILGEPKTWQEGSGLFWTRVNNGLNYFPIGTSGFIDSKDVANISRLLLEGKHFGESFILVEDNYKYQTILTSIAQQINATPPKKPLSKSFIRLLSNVSQFAKVFRLGFPVTAYELKSSAQPITYSNEKIKTLLNYQFIPIEQTIERVSKAFLNNQ